jgi:hypothetical protein
MGWFGTADARGMARRKPLRYRGVSNDTIDWWQPILRGLWRPLRPIFKGIARLMSWTGQ